MHLKRLIDLIAEQAARDAAKRATGDAPGAVSLGYRHPRLGAIRRFMKIVAIRTLARSARCQRAPRSLRSDKAPVQALEQRGHLCG